MTAVLSWLARHARVLLAGGVFVGILLPNLAALLNPLVTPAVIGTLTAALLRLDWRRLWQAARRPWLAAGLCGWQLIASPLLTWLALILLDRGGFGLPAALLLSLVLQAAAPPIGSVPVFALLLGLNAAFSVLVAVATVLLLPLTLTPLVALLPDSTIRIDLAAFFWRVTLMVLAPFALAALLHRLLGGERLRRNDDLLAAVNLLLLVVFAIAVMDGVSARLLTDPAAIGQLLLAACIAALALHAAGFAVFYRYGGDIALNAAICSGNRNMGLLLAVTAGSAGSEFGLYVGIAQIPMYCAPLALAALLRYSGFRV